MKQFPFFVRITTYPVCQYHPKDMVQASWYMNSQGVLEVDEIILVLGALDVDSPFCTYFILSRLGMGVLYIARLLGNEVKL